MRLFTSIALFLMVAGTFAQQSGGDATDILIKKLGSQNPKDREAATQTLQERPEAVPQLREALKSPDPEISGRAARILDYIDRRPMRELNAAVKDGDVERVIAMVAAWPSGKLEGEVWQSVRGLANNLTQIHEKKGGEKIKLLHLLGDATPVVTKANRITETTKGEPDRHNFLRVGEVDLDRRRLEPGAQPQNWFADSPAIVAARSVRLLTSNSHIIFAGGPVELMDGGEGIRNTLVVSIGDVNLNCALSNSLVIARGKVTVSGYLEGSRIISGKSVVSKRDPRGCIISENDLNPLGFIRWSDAAKDKVVPKSK